MNAATKIQRAKIALLLDEPFFGALLLNLRFSADDGTITKTMATDGKRLLWHPPFVDSMTEQQTKTVLAHEALHCALLHMLRRGDRDPEAWNIACDHAVNLHLDSVNDAATGKGKAAPFPWPKINVHKDPSHKGKCAEEIYSDVPQVGGGGQGAGAGAGPDDQGMGGVLDAPGDASQAQELEANWKVALTQAAQAAKMQGKLPADMARLVNETLNPPARWQDLLRAFIRETAKDDYSFSRPNPRYMQSGFILPSLHSQRLGRITVAIDTSGSITEEILNSFLGEVEAIISECRPACIELIDCDAAIHSVRECEPTDPLPRDFAGGGGTDFTPVFDHVDKAPEKPVCVIYFTDLYGSFPADPGIPTLWAVYGGNTSQAPFGQTIAVN